MKGTGVDMKLNKSWHLANPMPTHPSFEERLDWHQRHVENCGCREMPENVRREIDARRKADRPPVHR